MVNNFNRHINFLLFYPTSITDFKASALTWSSAFYRARNMWKWSHVCHCTYKMIWNMLASSLFSKTMSASCFIQWGLELLFALKELYVWMQEIFVWISTLAFVEKLKKCDKCASNFPWSNLTGCMNA